MFELPVARGPRVARIFVILALDAILAGAGLAMILSYLSARDEALERAAPAPERASEAEVEVGPAQPVAPAPVDAAPAPAADPDPAAPDREPAPAPDPKTEPDPRPDEGKQPDPEPPAEPPDPEPGGQDPPAEVADAGAAAGGDSPPGDGGAAAPGEEEVSRFAARINAVVARHENQLHRCYERASKTSAPAEPLEGRVDIRFRIMPDGTAVGARPVANTTGSEILAGCLVAVVESWEFPTGASAPLDFVWPFRFRARKP